MSRDIKAKIKVTGNLVADIPIAVGGLGEGDMVDMELALDGRGRYYIPGSSLAGPMRSWVELNLVYTADPETSASGATDGKNIADNFFGYMKKQKGDEEGYASHLFMEDAIFEGHIKARECRHGIQIDPKSGTVVDKALYTRALLPKGASFRFEMELDVEDATTTALEVLKLLLEALRKGDIRFGACKTRGFGVLKLKNEKVNYYDFSNAIDLDHWLDGEESASKQKWDSLSVESVSVRSDIRRYEMRIPWEPVSKIMVKSGRDGIETDMLPLVSGAGTENGVVPIIPGSSIKGVLRSQAERILRTIFDEGDSNALALVNDMFGDKDKSGCVFVDDVYLRPEEQVTPSAADWLSENVGAMDKVTHHEDHVAIDRFTGGASDGALYSARPVKTGITWDPIHIAVDFSTRSQISADSCRLVELALIELVARDMERGLVPLGFGTNRGMGEIKIDEAVRDHFPNEDEIKAAWEQFVCQS
jgi:CRISPR/Cas system CSM-associated protein Csm3 (group 7 of RAMP superfamily)